MQEPHRLFRRARAAVWRSVLAGGVLAAAAAVRAEEERVVIQLPYTPLFQFAGFYAAEAEGLFRDRGLQVELRHTGEVHRNPIEEVVTGRAQFGVTGGVRLVTARLAGQPIVAVAAIMQRSPQVLMTRAEDGLHTPHDLVGRRIAFDAVSLASEVRLMLEREGVGLDRIRVVPNRWGVPELATGEADAESTFITTGPYLAQRAGLRVHVIRPLDYGVDFYGDTLFTSEDFLRSDRAVVESVRQAVIEGWRRALADPARWVDWIIANQPGRLSDMDREGLLAEARQMAGLTGADVVELGYMNAGRWRAMGAEVGARQAQFDVRRLDGLLYDAPRPFGLRYRGLVLALLAALLVAAAGFGLNRRLQRLVERRTAELAVSERKQREIFDLAPSPLVVQDVAAIAARLGAMRREGVRDLRGELAARPGLVEELFRLKRVAAANRAALQTAGFASVDEMDRRLREIMTPQALEGFIRELEAIWEGRESQVMEKHYRTLARGDVHMRVTWSVERVDGRPDYSQARMVFTDITDIRRAEAALQASEERYRRLFAATPNPLYIFDAESLRILAVNDAAVERYGHAREDFLRLTVLDLRPEEDVPRFRATMERRRGEFGRSDGPMAAGLWRHRTRDGRVLTVEVFTHNLLFQDRRCVLVLPIDVTAKLEAERALRASEARYRELVENAAVGVYRSTPDGRFIAVNPALARIYGFETPDEMLRWNEREHAGASYADTDEHRRFTELIERHGRVEGFESQVTDRHGRLVWVSETSRAVRDEQGRLLHYEGFVTDITERRRLEAELLRASKLEAVGILAGGIAHDFNNILTVILGNVTLAEFDAGAAPGLRPMLQEAKRATLRARDLTQQLLTFAKGGDPVREAVALADIVRESAEFGMHGAKSRLELDLPGDLWPANADKGQLAQVVQNLVINAVQAMPDGGVVRIAAANAALGAGEVAGLAAGDYIRLTVRDTGTGIPPEHLPKIFDPYFTTKQQGSGLGLATVYSIVRKHQGAIVVDSELGVGSIFRFWLPALRSVAPRTEAASAEARPLSGRVLFLDDEEPIREMAFAYLARLGVDCVAVPDGAAAVREFRAAQATDRPFRLLVLDLTVPGGMGGLETLGVLRGLDPAIRAVVSSGYSQDPVMGNFRGFGFNAVLVKPYDLDQLGRVVAASLGRTAD